MKKFNTFRQIVAFAKTQLSHSTKEEKCGLVVSLLTATMFKI